LINWALKSFIPEISYLNIGLNLLSMFVAYFSNPDVIAPIFEIIGRAGAPDFCVFIIA